MRPQSVAILALIGVLAASCVPLSEVTPAVPTLTPAAGLANPASVFCQEQGFRLELRTAADGSQSGVCHFPDGSECDEWAYFRGECGPAATPPAPTEVTPSTAAPPAATALPTAPTAGTTTYTSDALGVSFDYLPEQNGQTIEVFEQDDTIYVFPTRMEPTAGQWVQVFPKAAGESLTDAITREFMSGHPAENCQVTPVAPPTGSAPGDNFEYAQIVVPPIAGEGMEAMMPRWRTCPQPYTVIGGIGYFQSDPLHPDKFLFFSIGQYGILAGDGLPWQATIRFE